MITIFTRKELLVTFDMKRQSQNWKFWHEYQLVLQV